MWFVSHVQKIQSKSTNIEDWELTTDKKNCDICPFVGLCSSGLMAEGFPVSGEVSNEEEVRKLGEYFIMQEKFIKNLKAGSKSTSQIIYL